MEKIKLSQYLTAAVKMSEDPSDDNKQAVDNIINQIQVREYLYLADKEVACMNVLSVLNDEFSATGAARFVEMGKVIYGLLSYCLNFENDLDITALSTPAIYDTIFINGLYSYIYEKCKEDYNRLVSMIDNMIDFNNIGKLVETASLLSTKNLKEWTKTMDNVKRNLSTEDMKNLITLANRMTNSGSSSVEKDIQQIAINQVQQEMMKQSSDRARMAAELDNKKAK